MCRGTSNLFGKRWSKATPAIHKWMCVVNGIVIVPGITLPVCLRDGKLNDGLLISMRSKPLIDSRNVVTGWYIGDGQLHRYRFQDNGTRDPDK